MAVRKLRDVGNDGNPNKVGDFNQVLGMGDAIKQGFMTTRRAVTSTDRLDLGDNYKVAQVISAFVTVGTVTGALAVQAVGATPTTGQVAATHDGDIRFAAADAVEEVEVVVQLKEGQVIEIVTTADATGLVEQLLGNTASLIIEAEQLDGAAPGVKTVVARAAAPSAGQVAITTTGAIQFNAEAANDRVRIKFVAFPTGSSVIDKLDSRVAF